MNHHILEVFLNLYGGLSNLQTRLHAVGFSLSILEDVLCKPPHSNVHYSEQLFGVDALVLFMSLIEFRILNHIYFSL